MREIISLWVKHLFYSFFKFTSVFIWSLVSCSRTNYFAFVLLLDYIKLRAIMPIIMIIPLCHHQQMVYSACSQWTTGAIIILYTLTLKWRAVVVMKIAVEDCWQVLKCLLSVSERVSCSMLKLVHAHWPPWQSASKSEWRRLWKREGEPNDTLKMGDAVYKYYCTYFYTLFIRHNPPCS